MEASLGAATDAEAPSITMGATLPKDASAGARRHVNATRRAVRASGDVATATLTLETTRGSVMENGETAATALSTPALVDRSAPTTMSGVKVAEGVGRGVKESDAALDLEAVFEGLPTPDPDCVPEIVGETLRVPDFERLTRVDVGVELSVALLVSVDVPVVDGVSVALDVVLRDDVAEVVPNAVTVDEYVAVLLGVRRGVREPVALAVPLAVSLELPVVLAVLLGV